MGDGGRLNCQEAEELLPWLAGGGLAPEERAAVRQHLGGCAACQAALEETRRAADVFGAHLPAPALAALAWDEPPGDVPADLARQHLLSCPECAEELSLLQQSRALEQAAELARPASPRSARPSVAVWAAPLAAGLVIGLGLGVLRTPAPPPAGPDPHAAELQRLRGENTALRGELDDARQPQVNLPLVELLPEEGAVRSAQQGQDEVVVPVAARQVVLLLGGAARADREASIELRDAQGAVVWTGAGLEPGAQGAYTVAVPASLLADGVYSVVVQAAGARPVRYALRVRRAK
jgi:putative zinc finger protein